MSLKRLAFIIVVGVLGLSGCSFGAHFSIGEKTPAPNTHYGVSG